MRINVYGEELTDRVEKIEKTVDGVQYYGLRIYLYMPVTTKPHNMQVKGPLIHREGDDDSSAITLWSSSKQQLRNLVGQMLTALVTSRKDSALVDPV